MSTWRQVSKAKPCRICGHTSWCGETGPDDDPDSPLAQVQGHNLTEGVLAFQQFFGLPVTGKLDDVTLTLMEMPRCGNKDIERPEDLKRRKKRYALHGKKYALHALSMVIYNLKLIELG